MNTNDHKVHAGKSTCTVCDMEGSSFHSYQSTDVHRIAFGYTSLCRVCADGLDDTSHMYLNICVHMLRFHHMDAYNTWQLLLGLGDTLPVAYVHKTILYRLTADN